jgi:hypothetical protein
MHNEKDVFLCVLRSTHRYSTLLEALGRFNTCRRLVGAKFWWQRRVLTLSELHIELAMSTNARTLSTPPKQREKPLFAFCNTCNITDTVILMAFVFKE